MDIEELAAQVEGLDGVRRSAPGRHPAEWRYRGRLVARQIAERSVVIRADFDLRDAMVRQHPSTFSVPSRHAHHMMVVADLDGGDDGAIEEALEAAWRLQRRDQGKGRPRSTTRPVT